MKSGNVKIHTTKPIEKMSLRVDRMKSKIQDIKYNMQPAMAMPSLRALREKLHLVHADTSKGGSEKGKKTVRDVTALKPLDFVVA